MTDKTIYFLAGLPRSGSTLLMNILAQNPALHSTPTSGILAMLVSVRNHWNQNEAFRAMDRKLSEAIKERVLRGMLQNYFSHVERPVCVDKNRTWCEYLELAEVLVGGRANLKVLVTVRDLRDVLASFERLYRKTSALSQISQESAIELKFKTATGRVEVFADDGQPVGRSYNAIRDAVTRGWRDCMHIVDYDELTSQPGVVMDGIYDFLGIKPHTHNFDHVEQVTVEDDFAYGIKDLHIIRPQVAPQQPQWQTTYDNTVFNAPVWKNIENAAQFWKAWK
jgi:sulfotransferase